MTEFETRPSEDVEPPKFPEMRRRGFFDDVPNGDDLFTEHPEMEAGLGFETADAQHIVAAIDRLTEQQRLANMIAWQLGTAENYEREIRQGLNL